MTLIFENDGRDVYQREFGAPSSTRVKTKTQLEFDFMKNDKTDDLDIIQNDIYDTTEIIKQDTFFGKSSA